MRVAKWGNSLAVRLPKAVVEKHGLKEGDEIQFGVAEGPGPGFEVEKKPSRKEILEGFDKYRGSLPADFKFDRDEAAGLTRLRGYQRDDET